MVNKVLNQVLFFNSTLSHFLWSILSFHQLFLEKEENVVQDFIDGYISADKSMISTFYAKKTGIAWNDGQSPVIELEY
ncbi:hypothetical protein [uncultured Brevibacillus sp.]|uniref:hypothetical protein n=1 Tax=uncultured Brevibacillus sp. TaxID=169970 RepID=UPI00259AA4FA|nr:hypothetical protein [uncultured Brevibacillus sp.]